ncbi:MAG TPA: hypothetical protein VFN21_03770 [Acidimicrobiales bacterium]|nr:hypothetical protein [Acidimicrobiales bacterium]
MPLRRLQQCDGPGRSTVPDARHGALPPIPGDASGSALAVAVGGVATVTQTAMPRSFGE